MENEIRYTINKDICIEIPKEMKSMTFQGFFTFLRKSLQIKYTRRIHIDSILKKCKGKFFKAINDCLRKCLKINIKKLPQSYITNISIEYNKNFFDFTINDLYNYFNLMPYPMDTILQKKAVDFPSPNFFSHTFGSCILLAIVTENYCNKRTLRVGQNECFQIKILSSRGFVVSL